MQNKIQEESDLILNLNSKSYKIPIIFANIVKINQVIYEFLIINHHYQVKSNINDLVFTMFLDFLVHDKNPVITPDNIQSFIQLNTEFKFHPLKDLIIKYEFQANFNTKYANHNIIKELSDKKTKRISKNRIKIIKNKYKNLLEELIAENLDDYLSVYGNEILNLPNEILNNIFNHPKRKLRNHDEAYKQIKNNYKEKKKLQIFSLLPTLDANKMNEKNLKDAISQRKQRNNMIPKIDCLYLLNKEDEKNSSQQKIIDFFIQKKLNNLNDLKDIFSSVNSDEANWYICEEINHDCGLSFKIDRINKTACVFNATKQKENFVIPSFVEFQGEKYIITVIMNAFKDLKNIKSIQFDKDSKLKTICIDSFANLSIENISIPSTVTKINKNAFFECKHLKTIEIPIDSELKYIENSAFKFIPIEKIYIPSGVTKIKKFTFFGCDKLKKVEISTNSELKYIGKSSFTNTLIEEINIPSQFITFGKSAFYNCKKLKTINFLNELKFCMFRQSSFQESNLEKLIIESKSLYIQEKAFSECKNLKTVEILKKTEMAEIGEFSFQKSSIENVLIQSEFIYIRRNAFLDCKNLKVVEISEHTNVAIFDIISFYSSSIINLIISAKNVFMMKCAFLSCENLKTIEITSEKVLIENAFVNSSIECINISSREIEFKKGWCDSTKKLTKINISNNNNYLFKDNILFGKTNLSSDDYDIILFASRDIKSVAIPSNIKIISSHSFNDCKELEKVEFCEPSSLTTIESYAFSDTKIKHISIPSNVTIIGENSFCFCQKLKTIDFSKCINTVTIEEDAFSMSSIKCVNISLSKINFKENWCSDAEKLTQINVSKDNANYLIKDNILFGKTNLSSDDYDIILFASRDIKSVAIPSNIKIISSHSFNDCKSLKKVEFCEPSSLTTIESYAFSDTKIKHISIPSNVTTINKGSFNGCIDLKKVKFSKESKLQKIGAYAFCDSKIESLLIPSTVTKLSDSSLSFMKNLKYIDFDEKSKLLIIKSLAFNLVPIKCFSIPPKVTFLQTSTFFNCDNLQIIEIQENSQLKSICISAFENSSEKIIMIPAKMIDSIQINK